MVDTSCMARRMQGHGPAWAKLHISRLQAILLRKGLHAPDHRVHLAEVRAEAYGTHRRPPRTTENESQMTVVGQSAKYLATRGLARRIGQQRSPAVYELTVLGVEVARQADQLAESGLRAENRSRRQSYRAVPCSIVPPPSARSASQNEWENDGDLASA
jgi:hypothetical protein